MKSGIVSPISAGVTVTILGAAEIYAAFGLWPISEEMQTTAGIGSGLMILAAGLYFMAFARRWRLLAALQAMIVLVIACTKTVRLLIDDAGQGFAAAMISDLGYCLVAIGMLALLKRERLTRSALAAGVAMFPLLSALFCLAIYIVNTPFLSTQMAINRTSPYAAFALALIAIFVEVMAVIAWRRDDHHSTRFMLFTACSGFACMAIAAWLAVIWTTYVSTISDSERDVATAASFIEGYTERALDGAELLAQKTLRAITDENRASGQDIWIEDEKEIIASQGALPQVYCILVTGADGTVTFHAGNVAGFEANLANRPFFQILRDNGADSDIGKATPIDDSGRNVFTLSHRIEKPAGTFAGAVVVAIDNQHFVPIFRRLDIGGNMRAALTKLNGDLLASSLSLADSGWADATSLRRMTGIKHNDDALLGEEYDRSEARIVTMRTNQAMGFTTVVSASREGILANWRHLVYSTALALGLVLLGGASLTWMCHRSIAREETLKRRTDALVNFQDAVFNSASSALLAADPSGVITLFNRAAETLLGYTAQEMLGRRSVTRIFESSELARRARELSAERGQPVEADISVVAAAALTDPTEEREWTCIKSDGSRISVMMTVSALRDNNGRVTGFLAVMTPSSTRRKAERDLRYSEARLRAILDNVIDGIITIDAGGIVQSVNPAVEKIFGYSQAELIKQNVKMLMPPPYQAHHDGYLENYLSTGHAQIIGKGREVEGRRKNGTVFPLDLAVSQVDLSGRAMFIGVIRDLSDQKRVERLKAEFVSTVSHELRTPLTGIRGALGLVNSGVLGEVPEDIKELTVVAEQSSERLIRLINDILDVEKIGSGQMKLDMQPTDLSQTVHRAIKDTRSFAEQFSVRLTLIEPVPGGKISGDFDRLVQIFTNLLSNAAKFSPKNGEVHVTVDNPEPGRIRVSVIDHGIGISEEFRTRIFEKFAQADGSDSKAKGGTGLGLNITKNLVEKMNGTISFKSENGVGTTFYVEFPLLAATKASLERPDLKKFQILHVEDDETIRTMVTHLLADQAEVWGASDVREGTTLADERSFDLAIIDLSLGDGNGLDVVPRLRTAEGALSPVIVFSAHDQAPPHLPINVEVCLVKSRATDRELADAVRAIVARVGKTISAQGDRETMS